MSRSSRLLWLFGVLLLGCPPPPEPRVLEMEPIGTLKNVPTTPIEEGGDSGVTTPNSGTPPPASSACGAVDFDNLLETIALCEVTVPRVFDVPATRDKLEVKVTASPATTPGGGHVDVMILLRNKSGELLPLYFSGEPTPRFEIEAFDAKGRRADLPAAKWPGYPKGSKAAAPDAKVSRVTLEKNGTARLKIPWEAVKTKWAPENAASYEGRGYPRAPAGPLAAGKYTLRVVLPILGDAGDAPKITVDVRP